VTEGARESRTLSRRALGATLAGIAAAGFVAHAATRRDTYRTYCGTLPMMGVPNDLPAAQTGFVFDPHDAPFASCHASTICETGAGLLCAWFGGAAEGAADTLIYLSLLSDAGWSTPQVVAEGRDQGHAMWNPVLWPSPQGDVLLFYKTGPAPARWMGHLLLLDQGGTPVAPPVAMPRGFLGPTKNKPMLLRDGRLLCPSSTEDRDWTVHFEWTADRGQTWEKSAPVASGYRIIQPALLQHGDGRLQALCRSRDGVIAATWSDDGGRSWSAAQATGLPGNNSGIDAMTLRDGRHALVYNPTELCRSPLHLAISDDGLRWRDAVRLDGGWREYSYPSIIQGKDGALHVSYTWRRASIAHARIDLASL
jgi:alpha-L-rhamnosidase